MIQRYMHSPSGCSSLNDLLIVTAFSGSAELFYVCRICEEFFDRLRTPSERRDVEDLRDESWRLAPILVMGSNQNFRSVDVLYDCVKTYRYVLVSVVNF
jgi:hypothetical protein